MEDINKCNRLYSLYSSKFKQTTFVHTVKKLSKSNLEKGRNYQFFEAYKEEVFIVEALCVGVMRVPLFKIPERYCFLDLDLDKVSYLHILTKRYGIYKNTLMEIGVFHVPRKGRQPRTHHLKDAQRSPMQGGHQIILSNQTKLNF